MGKELVPTLKLSLEMTDVLARTERVGLKINLDTLDEIEKMYTEELTALEAVWRRWRKMLWGIPRLA